MHIEGLQDQLSELSKQQELQARKAAEQTERLKRDKRRMDELVTLKEGQLEQSAARMRELQEAMAKKEMEWACKGRELEDRLKAMEKRYSKEVYRMQNEGQYTSSNNHNTQQEALLRPSMTLTAIPTAC
jgi:hypothetical protein